MRNWARNIIDGWICIIFRAWTVRCGHGFAVKAQKSGLVKVMAFRSTIFEFLLVLPGVKSLLKQCVRIPGRFEDLYTCCSGVALCNPCWQRELTLVVVLPDGTISRFCLTLLMESRIMSTTLYVRMC